MIFATIPAGVLYAIPVAVIFTVAWLLQYFSQKIVKSASENVTSTTADAALKEFLNANGLNDVSVVPSADYTYNDYNVETGSIELSLDVIGCVDVNSVVLALRAGGRALAFHNHPERAAHLKRLQRVGTVVFWIAFCVLSIGIMSSSLAGSVAGYGVAVLVGLINLCEKSVQKKFDAQVESFVDATSLFDSQTKDAVKKTLAATR